jgi:hypothetical protein
MWGAITCLCAVSFHISSVPIFDLLSNEKKMGMEENWDEMGQWQLSHWQEGVRRVHLSFQEFWSLASSNLDIQNGHWPTGENFEIMYTMEFTSLLFKLE